MLPEHVFLFLLTFFVYQGFIRVLANVNNFNRHGIRVEFMYEIRNYWIDPAHFDEWIKWFGEKAAPLFRAQWDMVGFWSSNDIPPAYDGAHPEAKGTPANLTWIIRWDDKEQRDNGWKKLGVLDEWKKVLAQRPGGSEWLLHIEAKFAESI